MKQLIALILLIFLISSYAADKLYLPGETNIPSVIETASFESSIKIKIPGGYCSGAFVS